MALPRSSIKTIRFTRVSIRIIKGRDLERISLLIDRNTVGNTNVIRGTAMGHTNGKMARYIKGSGKRIKGRDTDTTDTQMGKNITEGSRIIRNVELVFT